MEGFWDILHKPSPATSSRSDTLPSKLQVHYRVEQLRMQNSWLVFLPRQHSCESGVRVRTCVHEGRLRTFPFCHGPTSHGTQCGLTVDAHDLCPPISSMQLLNESICQKQKQNCPRVSCRKPQAFRTQTCSQLFQVSFKIYFRFVL